MVEPLNTRENLLKAAIEVIDRDGIKAVRVRDIVARAQVKEPSIYHYFGSRDGLIEAAQAQRYSRGLSELILKFDAMVRECSNTEDFELCIRRIFSAITTPEREIVRAVRADVLGSAMSRPKLKDAVAQAQATSHELLAAAIQHAQNNGWVRQELNPLAFAIWFTGMINGRLVYEIDPGQCRSADWDEIAVESTLYLLRQK